jgi:hypothetical protein
VLTVVCALASCPRLSADRSIEKEFCRRCTLMHADEIETRDLSGCIIGGACRVLNTLGAGFLTKV